MSHGQVLKMHVHHSDIYISFSNVNCSFISTYKTVGDLREKQQNWYNSDN